MPVTSVQMDRPFAKTYRSDTRKGILHNRDVIVKKLYKQSITPGEIKLLKEEIANIRLLAHKNLDMIIAAILSSPHISIITEYEPTGNLYDVLRNDEIEMNPFTSINICRGICEGMQYLHDHKMNHYNLKSKNVLV